MAEVIEHDMEHKEYASRATGNAGLTLGIIGTALGAMSGLGLIGNVGSTLFGGKNSNDANRTVTMTEEDLHNERQLAADRLASTVQYYEGQKSMTQKLTESFFEAYQRDIDNSFQLYKYSRDNKDELNAKIDKVAEQVGIMNAIRPYQDALINSKIDMNALVAQYNLDKKTCKCIYGQVVLPSTPEITGYGSYNPFMPQPVSGV